MKTSILITTIALGSVLLLGQETQKKAADQPPQPTVEQLQQQLQEKEAMIRSLQAQLRTTAKLYGDCANELTNDEQQLTQAKK
jgi:hypothetical protein